MAGFRTENVALDHAAVDAARHHRVRRGRVPIDLLRHAVWMILLAPEAEVRQAITWRVALPEGIAPPYAGSLSPRPAPQPDEWGTSEQTSLAWTLRVAGTTLAEGHLSWPYSSNLVESRAADRLRSAEQAMEERCPPRRPPRWVFESTVDPIVSEIDATPESLDRVGSELDAALLAAVREPCRRRGAHARLHPP